MASEVSSDPSSTGTAHFGQNVPDNARAGAGGVRLAAAPAVPEADVADEVQVPDIGPAGPEILQIEELVAIGAGVSIEYAPQRNRSVSSQRASTASPRSASQRGRGVGDVDKQHVRAGTTPGGSPASRTTAGGDGPVSPHRRLPDPSQASLTRDGGGGPLSDPCGADPNTYRDGVQHRSPNPRTSDTPVTTGSSGSSLGPSASAKDELTEAVAVTTGTTTTPPMLSTPSGPPPITQPIPVISTSTSSMSSWIVPPSSGIASGGAALPTADQRLEMELEKAKRENESAAVGPAAKRGRSPAPGSVVNAQLGTGVPSNPTVAPLPPPPVADVRSYMEAIQLSTPGPSVVVTPQIPPLALPTPQPSVSKTSFEEMYKVLVASNKAKDERIGALEETKKELEARSAAAANAAAVASSTAASVMASAQQQAHASAAALSQAAASEASARQQTQQILTEAARTASELMAGEIRVEQLEGRLGTQTHLGAHMNQRYVAMKTEYDATRHQLELAKMEIFKLSNNPPTCPECPRKQELIERVTTQLQANAAEIAGYRSRLEALAPTVQSWEERFNREVAKNAQLSQEVNDTKVSVTRLAQRGDELAERLRVSQASLTDASNQTIALQARVGEAEAKAARVTAELGVYAGLPQDVAALQTECLRKGQQAQAVVDDLIANKNAIVTKLTECQNYAQDLQNSVRRQEDVISEMSKQHASLTTDITAARHKATEDAQRIAEVTADRDALHTRCTIAAAGPPMNMMHPDVANVIKARCAEYLQAAGERFTAAEKEWQNRIQEKESEIETLQHMVNYYMTTMDGGEPSAEQLHEADWSDPNIFERVAADLGIDPPPMFNAPPTDPSSGTERGEVKGRSRRTAAEKHPGTMEPGGTPPPYRVEGQRNTTLLLMVKSHDPGTPRYRMPTR